MFLQREPVRSMSDPLSGTSGSFDFDGNIQLPQKELSDTSIVKAETECVKINDVTEGVPIPFITSCDEQIDSNMDSSQSKKIFSNLSLYISLL